MLQIHLVHAIVNLFHFEKIDQLRMLSRLSCFHCGETFCTSCQQDCEHLRLSSSSALWYASSSTLFTECSEILGRLLLNGRNRARECVRHPLLSLGVAEVLRSVAALWFFLLLAVLLSLLLAMLLYCLLLAMLFQFFFIMCPDRRLLALQSHLVAGYGFAVRLPSHYSACATSWSLVRG